MSLGCLGAFWTATLDINQILKMLGFKEKSCLYICCHFTPSNLWNFGLCEVLGPIWVRMSIYSKLEVVSNFSTVQTSCSAACWGYQKKKNRSLGCFAILMNYILLGWNLTNVLLPILEDKILNFILGQQNPLPKNSVGLEPWALILFVSLPQFGHLQIT